MKAYKMFYNEDKKEIDYYTFQIINEFDFSNDPVTNLYESKGRHNTCKDSFLESFNKLKENVNKGLAEVVKCKDCGTYFIIDVGEKEWFEFRNLKLPRRCCECRIARRKNKFD